jgi:hypothetical protein
MRNIKGLTILFIIICIGWSCNHKDKIQIIPVSKLKDILIDIQLADAYYMMHSNQNPEGGYNTDFYKEIFDKNGISKVQFDSSLSYYSKIKPKSYEEIYDEVLTELNRMSQEIFIYRTLILDSAGNLYKGRINIKIGGKGFAEKLPFEIAVKDTGMYEITVQLQIFNDDQSKNLCLTALSTSNDNKDKSKPDNFEKIKYDSSSKVKLYQVSKRISNRKNNIIRGWILDQDDQKIKFVRHINITMFYVKKILNQANTQNKYHYQNRPGNIVPGRSHR